MPAHNALASRMLIDQLTPHLPKDNEGFNTHVNRLQAMLDVATMDDQSSTVMMKHGVMSLTTGRVCESCLEGVNRLSNLKHT
jgi:hypothetical protein